MLYFICRLGVVIFGMLSAYAYLSNKAYFTKMIHIFIGFCTLYTINMFSFILVPAILLAVVYYVLKSRVM